MSRSDTSMGRDSPVEKARLVGHLLLQTQLSQVSAGRLSRTKLLAPYQPSLVNISDCVPYAPWSMQYVRLLLLWA